MTVSGFRGKERRRSKKGSTDAESSTDVQFEWRDTCAASDKKRESEKERERERQRESVKPVYNTCPPAGSDPQLKW